MYPMSPKDERLSDRTCKIINKGGNLILKRKDGWYLNAWTNIASGWDKACWGKREGALEIFDLKWAFAIAKLYDCKVIAFYPKRTERNVFKRMLRDSKQLDG
jgi:hypothetical protein